LERKPAPALERCIPFDTPIFFTWRSEPGTDASHRKGKLGTLFEEPEIEKFLTKALGDTWRGLRDFAKSGGELPIRGGAFGMCLTTADARSYVPEMAFAFYLDGKTKEFKQFFAGLLQAIYGGGPPSGPGSKPVPLDSRRLQVLGPPGGAATWVTADVLRVEVMGNPVEYLLVDVDSAVLIATSESLLKTILGNCHGLAARPLADHPLFRTIRAKLDEPGADAFGFLNFEAIERVLGHSGGAAFSRSFRGLGLDGLRAVGLTMRTEGSDLSERYFLYCPGERRGLLRLLSWPTGGITSAKYAPVDTLVFAELHLDLNDLYRTVLDILGSQNAEGARALVETKARFEKEVGFPIDAELLQSLGPECGVILSPGPGGGLLPDVLVCVRIRNADWVEERLRGILGGISCLTRREVQYLGRRITFVDLPTAEKGGGSSNLSPLLSSFLKMNYCIDGDFLLFSLFSEGVKNGLRRASTSHSLSTEPSFVQARSRHDPEVGGFLFVDLRRLFEYAYGRIRPLLEAKAAMGDFPLDLSEIPSVDTVSRHLLPLTGSLLSEDDGFLLRSNSPFGSGVLVGIVSSLVFGLEKRRGIEEASQPLTERDASLSFDDAKLLGDRAFYRGRMDEAARFYSIALARKVPDAARGPVLFSRGVAYHREGEYDEAREDFLGSIMREHFVRESRLYLARGYARQSLPSDAVRELRAAIAADPNWRPLEDLRDSDFDRVRNADEFRALVRELAGKR